MPVTVSTGVAVCRASGVCAAEVMPSPCLLPVSGAASHGRLTGSHQTRRMGSGESDFPAVVLALLLDHEFDRRFHDVLQIALLLVVVQCLQSRIDTEHSLL